VKGSRTRWDTTTPHATSLFTDDERIALYFPSRNTVEVYPVDRRLRALIVSPIPRLPTLRRHFRIELETGDAARTGEQSRTETLRLRLTPKDDALAEFIDEVRVHIDRRNGLARQVEMIDPEGDRTVIEFAELRTNVGLTSSDVEWNFPADARVVRPLDPKDGEAQPSSGSDQP
jgi:outer membrane lipoprotein-sorting protein